MAFAHTARSLGQITVSALRTAESLLCNASGHSIETVGYAVVILGFEEVRNLALTIAMINSVSIQSIKKRCNTKCVCAYHAEVQAKQLAEPAESDNLAAVYLGALCTASVP